MHYKKTTVDKLYSYDSEHKIYCSCGQYGVVFYSKGKDRLICKNCGKYIYKDKKTELKCKMLEKGILRNEKQSKKLDKRIKI